MAAYVLRRLWQMVPILLAVALLIFVIFSVVPGTFASSTAADGRNVVDAQVLERMNREFGLSDPVHVRFGKYVAQLARFDLGISFRSREPVTTVLAHRLWPTLQLTLAAMLFAVLLGVPLGFLAAVKSGGWVDSLSMVFAISGLSVPMFWFGLMLMYVFALILGWFPSFGYGGLRHLILPAVALCVFPTALLARTTRAVVLEILHADFVRTARAKGMSESRVVRWHLLRNAMVVVLTMAGLQFGSVIGQAVVIEKLFAWPGLGSLLVDSVTTRDIPVVQGCILFIVVFFLLSNLLVDVLCARIDPRIKYT
jgi:peptide/nickel transport system permease protein